MINDLDGQLSAAILNVSVGGHQSDFITDELFKLEVPFIFATTDNREGIAARFADRPYINKPYDKNNLLRILSTMIKQG